MTLMEQTAEGLAYCEERDEFARSRIRPLIDRFEEKVDRSTGCWIWTGSKFGQGYAQFWDGERLRLAHRMAYQMYVGPIPDGLSLDHLCVNPACVNPEHLEPVTHTENMRRMGFRLTECQRGHPFDKANTIQTAKGGKQCRTCREATERKRQRVAR